VFPADPADFRFAFGDDLPRAGEGAGPHRFDCLL